MQAARSSLVTVSTVVALALGVGAGGVHAQDPGNATPATIELPREIPEDIPSGHLDTPLGPARWVHLTGDAETLPDIVRPVPVPGGYVSLDMGGSAHGPCPAGQICQFSAELWFSPDLLSWTPRPLPVDADYAQLTLVGDEYWLTVNGAFENEGGSFDPPSLWRSPDASDWEPVDLTHLGLPPPVEMDWRVSLGTLAASGDTTIIPMVYEALNATSFLGLPLHPEGEDQRGEYAGLERADDGSYRVLGGYGDVHARVRFEPSDGGIRVIDAGTDTELVILDDVGMDFIEHWAANGGSIPIEQRVAVIREGRVVSVELPEPGPGTDWYTLFGSEAGFMAFQARPDGLVLTWDSSDGETWAAGEILGDGAGEPADLVAIWTGPDGVHAFSWDGEKETSWGSPDGIDWRAHERPAGDLVARIGSGWVTLTFSTIAFHRDDSTDVAVVYVGDLGVKTTTAGAGGYGMATISPNTIAHSVHEDERQNGWQRDHWIITFDDLPASEESTTGG